MRRALSPEPGAQHVHGAQGETEAGGTAGCGGVLEATGPGGGRAGIRSQPCVTLNTFHLPGEAQESAPNKPRSQSPVLTH